MTKKKNVFLGHLSKSAKRFALSARGLPRGDPDLDGRTAVS
jgi:hypothetical protein